MPPPRRKPPLTRELGALGEAIEKRRKERGLTQEAVGALLHTDHKLIGEAERGQRNLRYRTLVDLAGVLGISMGKLIARADRNLARAAASGEDGAGAQRGSAASAQTSSTSRNHSGSRSSDQP
jgi:transcriptional regulator with XRE-family HTH domain